MYFVVIYAFFGVNFIHQKFCPCKKNDKYEVWFDYLDDIAGDYDDGSGDDAKFFQLNEVGIKADAVNLFEDHDVCSERHTKPTNHEPSHEKSSA